MTGGLPEGVGARSHRLGFDTAPEQHTTRPNTRSSTPWKSKTGYSVKVKSVVPGALLLIQACCGLLLNAVQFFYAMGITDAERLAETEVQTLKTFLIVSSALGGLYLTLIALGAAQMLIRQRLWAGRMACILAVLPITFFAYGLHTMCLAAVLYPLALVGGIWGLVELFGRHATTQSTSR